MTLFKVPGEKKVRAPKAKANTRVKAVWSQYTVKKPVRCDHCVLVAHEGWATGAPILPAANARQKRKAGDETLLLCNEHARIQKEADTEANRGQEHVRYKRSSGEFTPHRRVRPPA